MKGIWISEKLYKNNELNSKEKEFLLWMDFFEKVEKQEYNIKDLSEKMVLDKYSTYEIVKTLLNKGFLDIKIKKTEKAKELEK